MLWVGYGAVFVLCDFIGVLYYQFVVYCYLLK